MNAKSPRPEIREREPTPTLEIDFDYYATYLSQYDLSDDQQRDLIGAIANIMLAFVDLGFGIAPGQLACDETDILGENFPLTEDDLLYLTDPLNDKVQHDAAEYYAAHTIYNEGDDR